MVKSQSIKDKKTKPKKKVAKKAIAKNKKPSCKNGKGKPVNADAGMQVRYHIGKSQYGEGIFFDEDVAKGTLVWKFKLGVNAR